MHDLKSLISKIIIVYCYTPSSETDLASKLIGAAISVAKRTKIAQQHRKFFSHCAIVLRSDTPTILLTVRCVRRTFKIV
jgi:hypothetical protein